MIVETPLKIFWSWQSDVAQAAGKLFVRGVLDELAAELSASRPEDAERPEEQGDTVKVDYDRLGEPGTPKLADTILRKISEAAVFVADVTLTGATKGGKFLCNSNVMIELGFAMRVLGNERIILVMNVAEGGKPDNLPFDLRHWSWPVRYSLSRSASEEARAEVAARLKEALRPLMDASLKAGKRALREDRRRRDREPELAVAFNGTRAKTLEQRVQQENRPLQAKSLDEVRREIPLLPIRNHRTSAVRALGHRSPFGRAPPPNFWTEDETKGYNLFVESFYRSWDTYLAELREYDLLRQRTLKVELYLLNDGTAPATNIDVQIEFPANIRLLEADAFPELPEAPEPPPLRPFRRGEAWARPITPNFDLNLVLPTIRNIEIAGRVVRFSGVSLKHHEAVPLEPFMVSLPSEADIAEFSASYRITANEPLDPVVGEIVFAIYLVAN